MAMSRIKTYNMVDVDPYLKAFLKAQMSDKFEKLKMQKIASDVALEIRVKEFLEKMAGERQKHMPERWRQRKSVLLSPRSLVTNGKDSKTPHSRRRESSIIRKPNSNVKRISIRVTNSPVLHNKNDKHVGLNIDRRPSFLTSDGIKREPLVSENVLSLDLTRDRRDTMPDINASDQTGKTLYCKDQSSHTKSSGDKTGNLPELVKQKSKDSDDETIWPGDPKAIGSIRRPRKNPEEMLAVFRSGEEARKLIREMILPCSKNCNKPDYVTEMERMSLELPSLIPAIKKARKDLKLAKKDDADPLVYVATEVHSALTLAPFKIESIYDKLYYDKKLVIMTLKDTSANRTS